MKITKEMEKDLKSLLCQVDELQKKYNGIYIAVCHVLGQTEILADVTVSDDNETFARMIKWSNGKYTK
jgi:hypothetical protein